jgi:hypothetical protein
LTQGGRISEKLISEKHVSEKDNVFSRLIIPNKTVWKYMFMENQLESKSQLILKPVALQT